MLTRLSFEFEATGYNFHGNSYTQENVETAGTFGRLSIGFRGAMSSLIQSATIGKYPGNRPVPRGESQILYYEYLQAQFKWTMDGPGTTLTATKCFQLLAAAASYVNEHPRLDNHPFAVGISDPQGGLLKITFSIMTVARAPLSIGTGNTKLQVDVYPGRVLRLADMFSALDQAIHWHERDPNAEVARNAHATFRSGTVRLDVDNQLFMRGFRYRDLQTQLQTLRDWYRRQGADLHPVLAYITVMNQRRIIKIDFSQSLQLSTDTGAEQSVPSSSPAVIDPVGGDAFNVSAS